MDEKKLINELIEAKSGAHSCLSKEQVGELLTDLAFLIASQQQSGNAIQLRKLRTSGTFDTAFQMAHRNLIERELSIKIAEEILKEKLVRFYYRDDPRTMSVEVVGELFVGDPNM